MKQKKQFFRWIVATSLIYGGAWISIVQANQMEEIFQKMKSCNMSAVLYSDSDSKSDFEGKVVDSSALSYFRKATIIGNYSDAILIGVGDAFHGLRVKSILLPRIAGTDVNLQWEITFNENQQKVVDVLSKKFRMKISVWPAVTKRYREGKVPAILFEQGTDKPVLSCNLSKF